MYLRCDDLSWESTDGSPDATRPESSRLPTATHESILGAAARRSAQLAQLPSVQLHGVRLHALTEAGCIKHILDSLDAGYGGIVVTPNLDHVRRCGKDMRFNALVAEADLVVADGMPLIWASRLQGTPLPERVAGSDLISSLSAAAAERGRTVFLLGGAPGTAEGAAKVLRERYPNLKIGGTYCPSLGFEQDEEAMVQIIGQLVTANPDIVYVALGSPKQELLVERIRKILPCAWWLGVGNSFSFLCGHVPRAPRWMQRSGLEWMHRLLQEPKRLFRRYIVVGIPFATTMMIRAVAKGLPRRLRRMARLEGPEMTSPDGKPATPISAAATPVAGVSASSEHPSGNGQAKQDAVAPGQVDQTEPGKAEARAPVRSPSQSAAQRLGKLKALVLLGGSVRSSPLTSAIGRSLLDLPLDEKGTILSHWLEHAQQVASLAGLPNLPVRVLVNRSSLAPLSVGNDGQALTVERDLSEYRGTGGVLRDLMADCEEDDLILVGNASQVLLENLTDLTAAMERAGGDVSVVAHTDGMPSGLMLVRGAALKLIAKQGFVDMKEQALPLIASRYEVSVVNRRRPSAIPVRLLEDYILALRLHHRRRSGKVLLSDPLEEDWRPTFSLIEPGALVDPNACIHDSVVLRGGRVESGAVTVRSLVCEHGVVKHDRPAVDQLVAVGAAGAASASGKTGMREKQ